MRARSRYTKGVALIAGIDLLVGILGTPVPSIAASPGEVAGKAVCWVVTLGVCIALLPPGEPFGRYSQPEPLTCTPARFTGPPTVLTKPIMTVKYQFHGSCSRADLPNAPALNYRLEGSWTPGESNPNKPNASESLEMTGYEPYLPDRAPGGRIFMYWTARCAREPWLSPEGGSCQDMRTYIPDDLRGSVTDLTPRNPLGLPNFPKSRNAIPANDRQQLYARYLQLTSPAATKTLPGVVRPGTDDMFNIFKPANNDRLPLGHVVVAANPPTIGMTRLADLEFTWLDAPPTQPFVNHIAVETSALLQGYAVPQNVARFPGRWRVRVRALDDSGQMPWSIPVQFELLQTQPTQSQKQPPPMVQQAPLPSSPVMQAPVPSSSAPAQLRRSPSLVMPRGVEEKESGSETVGTPPEQEKTP